MERRNVLVIGTRAEEYREWAEILARSHFDVDRFPSGRDALSLIERVPFRLLLVRFPLADLPIEELAAAVRAVGSPCEHTPLALLARRPDRDRAQGYVGHGVNRVLLFEDARHEVETAIAELLEVAPRRSNRVSTRLRVDALGGTEAVYCRSVNLSASGALLESDRRYAPGTHLEFELHLPGDTRSCAGSGEVARLSQREREGVLGFAVHFRSFEGDGQERLERFLREQPTVESFTPE